MAPTAFEAGDGKLSKDWLGMEGPFCLCRNVKRHIFSQAETLFKIRGIGFLS